MKTKKQIYTDRIKSNMTDREILDAYEKMKKDEPEYCDKNLGYMLGYFDEETRKHWYKILSHINHPIFGTNFGRGK